MTEAEMGANSIPSASVRTFFHEPTFTAAHLVWDIETRDAVIIDSALDYDHKSGRTSTETADQIITFVEQARLNICWILETHAHADHITAAPYLKAKLGGATAVGAHITKVQETFKPIFNLEHGFATDGSQFDRLLVDEDVFSVGTLTFRVIHTPGHTPACVTFVVGDAAFVGDTIFMPDYGTARVDFPGGDAATLYRSIQKIFELPDQTRLFMCHDYKAPGRDEFVWETTVASEKAENVHIHSGITETEFVEMRNARDRTLEMPVLVLPAIQVNIRAGVLPPAENNGVQYLKIPLNSI
jgi:glyoxylase-like metal-dependent hydrolase (beta-lactamase superfamily II)